MFKQSIVTLISLAALTVLPLPGVSGAAVAQRMPNNPPCIAACGTPNNPTPTVTTYNCSNEMGHLRRVYEEQLDGIEDPLRVSILPVCLSDDFGLMRQDGNAGALRQTIADNDAIIEALFRKNFKADDVVGIRMTDDDAVLLYVHPFYNR
jgi:hypothetical protein